MRPSGPTTSKGDRPPKHTRRARTAIESSRAAYQDKLQAAGYGQISTEILPAPAFYFAEGYHQQYLHKNPGGYRCHSSTGVPFPAGAVPAR